MNVKVLAAALAILIAPHISVATAYEGNDSVNYSKRIDFPTIGISLPQPEGFVTADEFEGIEHLPTLSSIHLAALKGSFSASQAGVKPAALKKHGVKFIAKTSVVIDGRKGLLVQASQRVGNIKLNKWLVLTGDRKQTVLAVATCPSTESRKIAATLRSILSRIKFLDPKKRTESENVGFSIGSSSKLKLVKSSTSDAQTQLYLRKGYTKSMVEPMLVAAKSISKHRLNDFEEFSIQSLRQTRFVEIKSVEAKRAITINGLHGYEMTASGTHNSTGKRVKLYQVTLLDGEHYIVIAGRVGDKLAKEFMPEFKSMASGFRLQ